MRYREITAAAERPSATADGLPTGVCRFCLGLGKKMVIADNLGAVVDPCSRCRQRSSTPADAWLGMFCYALQIYFDFSGYSDMAIGLAGCSAFDFPENFNRPIARRTSPNSGGAGT